MEREEAISYVKALLETQKNIESLTKKASDMQLTIEQTARTMESYRIRVDDEAQTLIRTKREELNKEMERSVRTSRFRFQQAQKKRMNAKNKQVKELIAEENADSKKEIVMIRRQIKNDRIQSHLPLFSCHEWFFNLFMPGCIEDYLKLIFFFMFNCFLLPLAVYQLIPNHASWYFYLILPFFMVITCASYAGIAKKVLEPNREVLQGIKEKRMRIYSLQKRIAKTKSEIIHQDDESSLSLSRHDSRLEKYKAEMEEAIKNQTERLEEFENVTRPQILDSFRQKSNERLEEMERAIDEASKEKIRCLEEAARLHAGIGKEVIEQLGSYNMNSIRLGNILNALENQYAASLEAAVYMADNRKEEPALLETAGDMADKEKPVLSVAVGDTAGKSEEADVSSQAAGDMADKEKPVLSVASGDMADQSEEADVFPEDADDMTGNREEAASPSGTAGDDAFISDGQGAE